MPKLVFIMGTTCSGKSSFLEYASEIYSEDIGTINVGAELRAKYPPEYFKGQASPKHTSNEAWQIFLQQLTLQKSKKLILVDGQPRDYDQTYKCLKMECEKKFLLFDAKLSNREQRLRNRFNGDQSSLQLGLERLRNDMISKYIVITELLKTNTPIEVIDTNYPPELYSVPLLLKLVSWYKEG